MVHPMLKAEWKYAKGGNGAQSVIVSGEWMKPVWCAGNCSTQLPVRTNTNYCYIVLCNNLICAMQPLLHIEGGSMDQARAGYG